ncbi:MAG: DUF362 domain-containing protein, partial [Halanaerobiales bacterium]
MEEVVVKKCDNYQEQEINNKLNALIKELGGIDNIISPGEKVLLKVNLIRGAVPEDAVTTHPVVVKEMADILKKAGAEVIVGDSPGGRFTQKKLKKIYNISGLTEIAQEKGIRLNYDITFQKQTYKKGKIKKSFIVGNYINKVDKIINMPKLKTHGLTMYTGAVKNLFGAIPGLLKGEYHLKMPEVDLFSEMLLDLALFIQPCLNIMDGVTGMEGEGPSAGIPRKFGYLMASTSSSALDIAAVYLLGIEPETKVPLINSLKNRNLPYKREDIKIKGDQLTKTDKVKIPQIEKKSNLVDYKLPDFIGKLADIFLR